MGQKLAVSLGNFDAEALRLSRRRSGRRRAIEDSAAYGQRGCDQGDETQTKVRGTEAPISLLSEYGARRVNHANPGHRGQGAAQDVRLAGGRCRHRPPRRTRRGVRAPGAQWSRQDDGRRDPGRPPSAVRWRGQRAGFRSREGRGRLQAAHRYRAAGDWRRTVFDGRRDGGAVPRLLPAPEAAERRAEPRGADGAAKHPGAAAVRRAAAAARRGCRPGGRPGPALPG